MGKVKINIPIVNIIGAIPALVAVFTDAINRAKDGKYSDDDIREVGQGVIDVAIRFAPDNLDPILERAKDALEAAFPEAV